MRSRVAFAHALLTLGCLLFPARPTGAAINAYGLGASYDSTQSNVIFRVYSSRASEIEVDLYASPMGSAEVLRLTLEADSNTNIFSGTLSVAALEAAGITGPIYYGYRAWGPNWPFSSSWTNGSSAGFISDVDAQGNRFNPNKLL
ncbi:MAG: glycogen-debranching protein, partial [Terriglobia bacterium]